MPGRMTTDFEKVAAERGNESAFADLWYFLRESKKWWLLPILVLMLMFGALMLLSGTAAAPFIYTIF
jgi:hypothetical protein